MNALPKVPTDDLRVAIAAYQRVTGKAKKDISMAMGRTKSHLCSYLKADEITERTFCAFMGHLAATWPKSHAVPIVLRRFKEAYPDAYSQALIPPEQPKRRPCMCCRKPFVSQGIHNRLCDYCKGRYADLPLQMVL